MLTKWSKIDDVPLAVWCWVGYLSFAWQLKSQYILYITTCIRPPHTRASYVVASINYQWTVRFSWLISKHGNWGGHEEAFANLDVCLSLCPHNPWHKVICILYNSTCRKAYVIVCTRIQLRIQLFEFLIVYDLMVNVDKRFYTHMYT